MKTIKKLSLLTALFIIFPCFNVTHSQTVKKPVIEPDNYSVTIYGGISQNKEQSTNENSSSGIIGLRVAYDVNEKLSLGGEVSYNSMRDEIQSSSMVHMTYGPRYYVNLSEINSSFFFDVAMGGYIYTGEDDRKTAQTSTQDRISPSDISRRNKINLGLSGSIGGEVSLNKTLGLTVRGSYHSIFEGQNSNNFYTIQGGVRVKL